MDKRQARRVTRELTSTEKERLAKYRQQIAQELPDLTARDQMRKDAREESTLSGELRQAIHDSGLSLAQIAVRAGVTPVVLDDFLTGERTLRSDVIDRLTGVLGCELTRANCRKN
jgi:ribosome-binding protein aMBF1 (putative translation factor)